MVEKIRGKFEVGFWHPFGAHGHEERDHIIQRKQNEIKNNKGWTLWSFQKRKEETLNRWLAQIPPKSRVFVLCSDSKNAKDPKSTISRVKQYRFVNSDKWEDIPDVIQIPHPFGHKDEALAFKVRAIYKPEEIDLPQGINWLYIKDNKWREDRLPTRGEYLIKSGGQCKLRKVYQILELESPYLAILRN